MERQLRRLLDRLYRASPAGNVSRELLSGLLQGRLDYCVTWDDLRAPASGINPPGAVSDPTKAEDGTLLFAHNAVNLIAILFQLPHAWKEGSEIRPHIHWMKTTDASGDVAWEYRYRIIGIGDTPPAWSDWLPAVGRNADPGATQAHTIDVLQHIDMEGKTLSAMVSVQLRRNTGAAKDTYGTAAALLEVDIHYQIDSIGSAQEYIKGGV